MPAARSSPRPRPPRAAPRVALLVETSLASGRDILRGIARAAKERGPWSLYHAPGSLEESVPRWIDRWQGDGIIARVTSPEMAHLLRGTGRPVVDVLGLVPEAAFPLVHVDNAAIGRLACAHLAERGFRRFACCGIAGENWSQQRRDAFLAQARATDPSPSLLETSPALQSGIPWEERQNRLARWLQSLPKPVGLLVCSDQLGSDVLEACRRAAISVPDTIAVVGVDNDEPLCEVCQPALSSIWPDHAAVGYQAATLLDQLMSGHPPPPGPQFIAPKTLIVRQSSDVLAVDDPAVSAALHFIREHACHPITTDEIARHAGTSRSVLQRRFQTHLGQTIHTQIVQARLKRATELITSTDLPLLDIAERCGFQHQEYMGKVIKDRLGRTPGDLRRAARRSGGI